MKAARRPARRVSIESDEPADRAMYEEYVRGFDEVPILDDAVRTPPRSSPPPNFVRGERRSLRKAERADGYSFRQASLAAIEALYDEYLAPAAEPQAGKTSGSKRRRKSSATA
jgi:hypothetical protein